MPTRLKRALLSLLLGATACDASTAPDVTLPDGAIPYAAPAVYRRWWEMTAACANNTIPLERVRWYYTKGQLPAGRDGPYVLSYYEPDSNRIVMAESGTYAGSLVRHAMLHAILGRTQHPRNAYLGQCAGIVDCDDRCVRDAGAAPPADSTALRVSPTSLSILAEFSKTAVSKRDADPYFDLVVTVRNPLDRAVIVELPESGDDGPAASFRYRLSNADGGYQQWYDERAWDLTTARFAPGEVKRWVFDIGAIWLDPGTYSAAGAFGSRFMPAAGTVTISP